MSGPVAPTHVESTTRQGKTDEWECPLFVRAFPADPELDILVQAFIDGNYALIRAAAPQLAERSESEAVRRAARELRRRISPAPMLLMCLAASVALFAFLVVWAYLNQPA
jgi:hypothetical protein